MLNRLMMVLVLLCASFTAQASRLVELAPNDARRVVVLVGGVGNSHTYFESWVPSLASQGRQVLGFEHDHRAMRISEGAEELARELQALEGTVELVIHAHSMGGLLAKRALQLLQERGELSRFTALELHTYGTPWGGFFAANFARWIPMPHALALKLGIPMAQEIGSLSPFMQAVAAPLPGDVIHVAHEGDRDLVGVPTSEIGLRQHRLALSHATLVVTHVDVDHDGFAQSLLARL